MNFIQSWKKYKKDWLLVIGVVLVAFLAVSADGFSDLANKKFWWNFWSVVHIAAIATCVIGWFYLKANEKKK